MHAVLLIATMVLGQNQATADEYLAFWKEYFQGEWTTTIVAGEETGAYQTGTQGGWACRLGPTGTCMLFTETTNGRPIASAIAGYDPKSKAWKEVFFQADGSHFVQFYRAGSGDLSGDAVGKVLKGEGELAYPDGRVELFQIRLNVVAADKFKYAALKRRIGKEGLPDLVFVFERKEN